LVRELGQRAAGSKGGDTALRPGRFSSEGAAGADSLHTRRDRALAATRAWPGQGSGETARPRDRRDQAALAGGRVGESDAAAAAGRGGAVRSATGERPGAATASPGPPRTADGGVRGRDDARPPRAASTESVRARQPGVPAAVRVERAALLSPRGATHAYPRGSRPRAR